MAELEKLYSIDAAAAALGGISRYTVVLWLSRGKLQRTKVGRRTMITESEIRRIQRPGEKSWTPVRPTKRKEAVVG